MDWKAETLKKEIIPNLPDVSALHPTLKDIYFTALYQCITPDADDHKSLIEGFAQIARTLRDKFSSGARITTPLRSFMPLFISSRAIDKHKILSLNTPYPLNSERRFSHTFVQGRSGSGKTTLLENLIDPDIANAKRKLCSVVVMDSQGRNELLGRIEKWQIIDDVAYKIIDSTTPLNPFHIGTANNSYEREMLHNNAIEMLSYIFGSVLGEGGALTSKQRTLFDYCVALLLTFQSSIVDLMKLMEQKGLEPYAQYIPRTNPQTQIFFNTQFNSKGFIETKTEIAWRLAGILKNNAFARMFTAQTSFDFYAEMQKPQVLLIDADIALLKEEGSAIMQRYVIAQLLSAAERRATTKYRLPTYVYIDEAAIAIAQDENVARIIDRARKFKVGFTFAIQRESQIKSPNVLDALKHCEYRFTPSEKYKWRMEVQGLQPITISSPLVDRGARKPDVSATPPPEPPIDGEIIPPDQPTPVDNLQLTYDSEDISPK